VYSQVIVPLDGSDSSARALAPAARLAERSHARVLLLAAAHTRAHRRELEGCLVERAAHVRQLTSVTVDHRTDIASGGPASCVVAEMDAHPDSVVCMASVGRSRVEPFVGSVAEAVMTAIRAPVLLVGPAVAVDDFALEGAIEVPLDGTEPAESVLPIATTWSSNLGLDLRIVSVLPAHPDRRAAERVTWQRTGYLRRTAHTLHGDTARHVEFDLLHGDVGERIVDDAARHACLVAMATGSRTAGPRVALGSVAMRVVHDANVPVLAYRS
jgi:nucleotide-binding universal stress UspA family protein